MKKIPTVSKRDPGTDKGDLRSQGVRAEGADVVATGTSGERAA